MKNNRKLLVGLLLSIGLTSCNNSKWQIEYDKELNAAFQPIQEKYEFIKAKIEECEVDENNDDCRKYNCVDELSEMDAVEIVSYLPDSLSENSDWPYGVLVLHKAYGVSKAVGLGIVEKKHEMEEAIDCCKESITKKIGNRIKLKQQLSRFDSSVVQPISKINYVVLLKDVIYVRPKEVENTHSFSGGYLLDEVEVYDLNSMEMIDSFFMASENSDNVSVANYSIFDLPKDLCVQMKNNVNKKLKEIIVNEQ